ncbi:unnamed protein product [Arabis nemorensis]|uniref:Importin subunit alpha n=1 Tax=Arabis nemorensis TaxID=586526 RepID=A0A565C0H2_9BRAS|nr:unnamed protein product [Arabis nemorensis]
MSQSGQTGTTRKWDEYENDQTQKGTTLKTDEDEENDPTEKGPVTKKRRRLRDSVPPGGGHPSSTKILLDNLQLLLAGIWAEDSDSQLRATSININLIRTVLSKLQYEAAWALTHIASENQKVIVENGAIALFVHLLGSARKDVRAMVVGALGNIAGGSIEYRNLVLSQNAMAPLLSQFKDPMKPQALRNAAWTLSNFCCGKPKPSFEQTKPALPVLERLVQSTDEEVLTKTCSALSYLSDGSNDRREAVINAGIIPHLIKLISHSSPLVLIPALHTIGNIVTGNDDQTLVAVLQTAYFEVKEEAACEISKATHNKIKFLVKQGCINPICNLLACQYPSIITASLVALESILRVGEAEKNLGQANVYASMIVEAEGHKKIQNLHCHDNNDVNQKAAKILKTFWTEDGQGNDEKHASRSGS